MWTASKNTLVIEDSIFLILFAMAVLANFVAYENRHIV